MISSARGGGVILSGIIKDTMVNSPAAVHMKSLERLIAQTTGVPRERPIMEGVIRATVPSGMRDTPEMMPNHERDATASKMASGTPYSGAKSGYGMAQKGKKGRK